MGKPIYVLEGLETPCIPWDGDLNRDGYGRWGHHLAHRRVWEEYHLTDIPEGMTLDHTCHNADPSCTSGPACPHRRCVNVEHLELVTQTVNSQRRWAHRRNR